MLSIIWNQVIENAVIAVHCHLLNGGYPTFQVKYGPVVSTSLDTHYVLSKQHVNTKIFAAIIPSKSVPTNSAGTILAHH